MSSALATGDGYHEGADGELDRGLHDEEFFDWNLRADLAAPVLLSRGRSLYAGLEDRIDLTAGAVTVFRSGNTLLRYRPPLARTSPS
ncbi:hypothetical protein [Streptomyces sp. NPDC048248]|uniref:hypothetical protein n=1 Tax=Streptomyces sp. NPDC048248 TaxID=3365523 RepID=UPI0037208B3C